MCLYMHRQLVPGLGTRHSKCVGAKVRDRGAEGCHKWWIRVCVSLKVSANVTAIKLHEVLTIIILIRNMKLFPHGNSKHVDRRLTQWHDQEAHVHEPIRRLG